MAQQVTIHYCGVPGTGPTVTKAKQDAARKIEMMLSGDWTPYLLAHKGWFALVARSPLEANSWGYKLFQQSDESQNLYLSNNYTSRADAIDKAAYHLAQNAGSYEGLERWIPSVLQRDLDDYFAWQASYAQAKARGLSDAECRAHANTIRFGRP